MRSSIAVFELFKEAVVQLVVIYKVEFRHGKKERNRDLLRYIHFTRLAIKVRNPFAP